MGDAPGDVRNEWQKAFSKILGFIPHTSGRDLTNNIFPWPEDVKTQPPPVSSNRIESILTKDFINMLGGSIKVESALNKGTCVYIYF
jgi:hypothetical protein